MESPVVGNVFMTEDGTPIVMAKDDTLSGPVSDHNWARAAFVLAEGPNVDPDDLKNRYWNSARSKFTDGRFGCNVGINCHPQFTAYADPPEKGRMVGRVDPSITESSGNYGLGGFWSDIYDTPEQIIYLRFGVPQFNNPLNFFTSAYNYGASVVARTGRWPTFIYDITHFAGQYLTLRAFPLITIPLLIYRTADYFYFRQSAKFYTMRPTMHLYWGAVNNLVNTLAINSGIYPKILNDTIGTNGDDTTRIGMPLTLDQSQMDIYHELAPDLFTKENYIDVYALANRAQRIANETIEYEFNEMNSGTNTDWGGFVKRELTGNGTHATRVVQNDGSVSFFTFLEHFLRFGDFYKQEQEKEEVTPDPRGTKKEGETEYTPLYSESSWNNFKKHLTAEFSQGGAFAVFRVSATGSKSESFSNATVASSLESKMNGIASNFQETRFTFGGVKDMLGGAVGSAINMATDALMGGLDGLFFDIPSSVKGLFGEGYVEIPEHWQSSSSSLPQAQYKIQLNAWNASVFTRIFKLYVPFAMLAAGSWPRSTGRQSYTAPFLCQIYDQGRVQIPLGMITEFSVTRGDGNLGFTVDNSPLSMTLSFTVKDLSRVLHMPLTSGKIFQEPTMIDEDSAITNYLATVAGQSMYNQIYPASKAKVRAAKLAMASGQISSPAFWASFVHDNTTDGIGKLLTLGVGSLIEAGQRNADVAMGSNGL